MIIAVELNQAKSNATVNMAQGFLSHLKRQVYVLKRERSGLLTLLSLLLFYFGWMDVEGGEPSIPESSQAFWAMYLHYTPIEEVDESVRKSKPGYEERSEAYFTFSPNEVAQADLVRLGLSEKQAAAFIRYRERGRGFNAVDEVAKVFVLPEGWLDRHQSDMVFEPRELIAAAPGVDVNREGGHPSLEEKKQNNEEVIIDINATDSVTLVGIRGIGGVSAQRILAYRERLGGFHSTAQYNEIWGLHPEVVKVLSARTAPLTEPVKIDLNTADAEVIGEHPYIRYKLAKSLVAMRSHRGRLDTADLRSHHLVTDSLFERILPYLYVEKP